MRMMVEKLQDSKYVRFRSHLDKFLVADDNQETVRLSKNGSSQKAWWRVEASPQGCAASIRLKSCHGKYLTASDTPFLLGATGKKVTQSDPATEWDPRVDWEPLRDGHLVKLRAASADGGRKYLRANGGAPPWRNSVTHDDPYSSVTQQWVLWDVEAAEEIDGATPAPGFASSMSSFSSSEGWDGVFSSGLPSPSPSPARALPVKAPPRRSLTPSHQKGMDFFRNAQAVRLRSHHDKYLTAEDDEQAVTQDRSGSSRAARWSVEFVSGSGDLPSQAAAVRLKSCYGKYLTASNHPFLLGMTGWKVTQSLPARLDASLEWVPIREGPLVKLRTLYGNFLRANGGLPPWRNSVTHDVPHRTVTQDWILWDVQIVEILPTQLRPPPDPPAARPQQPGGGTRPDSAPPASQSSSFSRQESIDSPAISPPRMEGRTIYYTVADGGGRVDDDDDSAAACFTFKGNGVEELTHKLEEETGLEDVVVCSRSPLNGQLYPLRLKLPPNNAAMRVVVLPSPSKLAGDFAK